MSILLLSIQKCINRLNTELVSKLCFNVWGCLSLNGVGDLHWVKGILTGPEYRKILIHHFVPSANRLNSEGFIFQQDNDPKHTSNVAKKYLQNKKIEVMNWQPQSPDLNSIENLWGQFNRLTQDRNPQNEDELAF